MAIFDLRAEHFEFIEAAEKRGDGDADALGEGIVASGGFVLDEAIHTPKQFEMFEESHISGLRVNGLQFDWHGEIVSDGVDSPIDIGKYAARQASQGLYGRPVSRKTFCPMEKGEQGNEAEGDSVAGKVYFIGKAGRLVEALNRLG